MVYSKYGPLVERLRYVATHPPELPIPWAARTTSSRPDTTPTEGAYQRSPLYRAERRMNRAILTPWVLYSMEDVRDYGNAVLQRASGMYSRASYSAQYVQGAPGIALYQGGTVTVPLPVRQTTILHELAHHLTATTSEHGQDFQDAYAYLLTLEMGEAVARKLVDNLQ
jgi:hypothetical protein